MQKSVELNIPGREYLKIELQLNESNKIENAKFQVKGSLQFLTEAAELRAQLNGDLQTVALPEGKTPGALLLKEALLKLQDKWDSPFCEEELCHCRAIPTIKVERAILIGAHDPETVSAQTSASTACGTCRPDVEALIKYRLK